MFVGSEKAGLVPAFLFLHPSDTSLLSLLLLILAIIGIVTLIATKEWLRRGWVSRIVYGGAGCAIILLMYRVDVPPDWFDGEGEGFWMALSLLLWAFVLSKGSERTFGRPLLVGMGATLVILNLYAHF